MESWLPLIVLLAILFGITYLFTIRPIRQREKRHDEMVEELEKGDLVITAGGIFGQVENIEEGSIILRVESGATIRVTKGGIASRRET